VSISVIARAARTGVQQYSTGAEYRHADEVFAPDSMASWVGAPVTIGHPGEVTAENVRTLAVGYVKSVTRDRSTKDEEHVRAELVIFDAHASDRVNAGELVELSAGYSTEVVDGCQTLIRVNHVALLPSGEARCGPTCAIVR
jgi:hypothetical protein